MRPPETFVGQSVRSLQTMLRTICAAEPALPPVIPDGIYGPQTMTAVSAYQRTHGLPVTGITDQNTWDAIVRSYRPAQIQMAAAFPARIQMKPGQKVCKNQHCSYLPLAQAMLTVLAQAYPEIPCPSHLGVMDEATVRSLTAFQKHAGLSETGELDKESWKHLCLHYTPTAARLEKMRSRSKS